MTDQQAPAPSEDHESPRSDGDGHRRGLLWIGGAIAVLLGVLVGVLLAVVFDRDSSNSNGTGQAVCPAIPVADKVLPSIVTIGASAGQSSGNGSGEIIAPGGYILTNNHVIAVAASGGSVSVLYSDGKTSPATIVGRDPSTDVAVIKAENQAADLPTIATTSSADLRVGQPVVALGAPLGLSSTVTSGIVSALDRYVPVPGDDSQTAHLIGAIQTDASINPGNSGGALVDCRGRMVGMNTAIATVPNAAGVGGGGSVGLGFAIPIDLAKPLAEEIIATGAVTHPTPGMQVQAIPPAVTARAGLPLGLYVQAVTPGAGAAEAGIMVGDVITKVDGRRALSSDQITVATLGRKPGDTIEITYERNGQATTTAVTLG